MMGLIVMEVKKKKKKKTPIFDVEENSNILCAHGDSYL
jgi:hypothetical protein